LEGIIVIAHAHDPISQLLVDFSSLPILTPKHHAHCSGAVWEMKIVLYEPPFTATPLGYNAMQKSVKQPKYGHRLKTPNLPYDLL
jgi:hypothetical protein